MHACMHALNSYSDNIAYLKLNHLCYKPARIEGDLDFHHTVCRYHPMLRLDHKCSTGLQHCDLVLKINWHIACQADTFGVGLTHSALAKADTPWKLGLIHHWVCVNRDKQVLTLCISDAVRE